VILQWPVVRHDRDTDSLRSTLTEYCYYNWTQWLVT